MLISFYFDFITYLHFVIGIFQGYIGGDKNSNFKPLFFLMLRIQINSSRSLSNLDRFGAENPKEADFTSDIYFIA